MINRLKLRNKFILGFAPLLIIILLFGALVSRTFFSINQLIVNLQETVAPDAFAMLEFKEVLVSLDAGITARKVDRRKSEEQISRLRELVKRHLAQVEQGNSSSKKMAEEIRHHAIRIMGMARYILNLSENGWRDTEEMNAVHAVIRQELLSLGYNIEEHLALHLERLDQTERVIAARYRQGTAIIWAANACGLCMALYMVLYLARTVLYPIAALRKGVEEIGNGALDYDLSLSTGDEFEELAQEFKAMAWKLKESYDQLDRKIMARTQQLSETNAELIKEVVERILAEEEQKKAEARVHILTQELLRVQEVERKRIALDLHDNIAQELSALKVMSESLTADPCLHPAQFQRQTGEWAEVLKHCVGTVRELAYNLWPSSLEHMGIKTALAEYCRDFTKKTGRPVEFSAAGMDRLSRSLDYDIAINIYRLVQEALNNIRQHAAANRSQVKLVASGGTIVLQIVDDGKGCDLDEVRARALAEKRFGLLGMQERVRLLNGSLTITSRPHKGTRILIEIPWDNSHADDQQNRDH